MMDKKILEEPTTDDKWVFLFLAKNTTTRGQVQHVEIMIVIVLYFFAHF